MCIWADLCAVCGAFGPSTYALAQLSPGTHFRLTVFDFDLDFFSDVSLKPDVEVDDLRLAGCEGRAQMITDQ